MQCSTSAVSLPVTSFESPKPTKRDLNKPPQLSRRKRFVKTLSDSDSDSDSDSNHSSHSNDNNNEMEPKFYNLRSCTNDAMKNSPQRSQHKSRKLLRKRCGDDTKSIELRDSASPMKRPKKTLDHLYNVPHQSSNSTKSTSCSLASNAVLDWNDCSKPYSNIKYLESIGSIRTIRRAKHPGINKVPTAKTQATPFISPESQNGWDRKTKLKISYRNSLLNRSDIQFALIIYEPLTMVTRRNLLSEFEKAFEEEEEARKKQQAKATTDNIIDSPLKPMNDSNDSFSLSKRTPTSQIKPKNERVSSLRRLRF